jgi:uncharacterized membrane protein
MGFYDMMTGPGDWGMWIFYGGMAALWVAWAVVLLIALRATVRQHRTALPGPPERALDVLERRYAAGEIDAAEFRSKKRDLNGGTVTELTVARPVLHLVTQARSGREIADLDWGPRPVA